MFSLAEFRDDVRKKIINLILQRALSINITRRGSMNFKKGIAVLCASCLCGSVSLAGNILLVGLNNKGEAVEMEVQEKKYQENLRKAIVGVELSALPTLQKKSESSKGWMLRSAVLGIGVNLEIGLGEAKFGVLPRFRMGFSNAKEPSMP